MDYRWVLWAREVQAAAHLPARTLCGLRFLEETATNAAALEAARRFSRDFRQGERGHGLYLHGDVGTGKSAILAAVGFEVEDASRRDPENHWRVPAVQYWGVPDLFRAIKRGFDGDAFDMSRLEECPLLILDDLGKQYDTSWSFSELFGLLQARYEALRATCFTSNYSLPELSEKMMAALPPELSAEVMPLVDRIFESCAVVELSGTSRRGEIGRASQRAGILPAPGSPEDRRLRAEHEQRQAEREQAERDQRHAEFVAELTELIGPDYQERLEEAWDWEQAGDPRFRELPAELRRYAWVGRRSVPKASVGTVA